MSGVFVDIDKVMRMTLLLSLTGHLLFLGMPFQLRPNSQIEKNPEDLEIVYIEIEKPPLLPKIEVMGKEKKLINANHKSQIASPDKIEDDKQLAISDTQVIDPADEAMLRYQDMVKQRIEEVRRYPAFAKRQGIQGTTYVNFLILSNGASQDIKIIHSSGSKILDEEAVTMIKRANPFPSIPKEIGTSFVQLEVSIVFKLN